VGWREWFRRVHWVLASGRPGGQVAGSGPGGAGCSCALICRATSPRLVRRSRVSPWVRRRGCRAPSAGHRPGTGRGICGWSGHRGRVPGGPGRRVAGRSSGLVLLSGGRWCRAGWRWCWPGACHHVPFGLKGPPGPRPVSGGGTPAGGSLLRPGGRCSGAAGGGRGAGLLLGDDLGQLLLGSWTRAVTSSARGQPSRRRRRSARTSASWAGVPG